MSITNNIELQQGIVNLQQRLEVPVRFLTKEDLTSLVTFLSDTNTYLYGVILATSGVSENISVLKTLYDNLSAIQTTVTFITENDLNINAVADSIANVNSVAAALVNINNVAGNLTAINNASTYATTATNQAGIAITQAGIATTKAGEASTSATNANNSFINFDKRYLGAKTSNPTLDNEGAALTIGALYYNTAIPENRVYNGSSWVTAYSASSGGITSVGLNVPTGLSVTGSPLTANGTLAITLTSGYSIPTTASQSNWDTAYTDRNKWDGGSTGLIAATGRTSLGATTIGSNLFTLSNPSAITFPRFNADNTISNLDASSFRTAIGAGTSSTTGTVTSVGLSLPSEITVSNSPVTGSGTLTGVWTNQTAKYFFAAPNGSAGTPLFRAIVATDIPILNQSTSGNAATVTNATFTTSLIVNTGTVTLTGNAANTSVLTIGAGAVSVSGNNTGDQTNISGNAATVTTNANLTGEVTSTGNATTLTNSAVIGKVLTGYVSGAGTVAATDSILSAIQKLNGNIAGISSATPGTASIALGTVAANGSSANFLRCDATVLAFDATAPTTQAFNDTASVGVATVAARRDHKHAMMAAPTSVSGNAGTVSNATFTTALVVNTGAVTLTGNASGSTLTLGSGASSISGTNTGDQVGGTPALVFGTANTAGSSTNFIRRDDTILVFDTTVPVVAGTAAVGVATTCARRDHVHPAQTTVSGNAGTASTANALNTANSYQVVNLTATGRISLADGTAALPSLYFASDGAYDTGLYWGGDGVIRFASNGVYVGQISAGLTMVGAITGSNLSGTNTGDQTGGTPALTFSTTNTAGSSTNFLRRDDTIAIFDATAPTTQAFGDTAVVGTAAIAARRDHKHAMPAQPTTVDGTNPIGYKNIPHSGTDKTTSYTLATTDVGKYISIGSGGSITIPNSTFADGDVITIYNNTSSSITVTCTITTAYIAGTNTDKDTVSLATRGLATIFFNSGIVCVIMGNIS